jgi:hypothetical protein
MRDKNLTQEQFNIQLEKNLNRNSWMRSFSESLSRIIPNDSEPTEVIIKYPRSFKSLRSLAIVQWYLPEKIRWQIFLDMEEMSFSHLNLKQVLEIRTLLQSKEIMQIYLYQTERFTNREIFGNILGNELRTSLQELKIQRKNYKKPKRIQRHRGYRDKGSWKPPHRWTPNSDFSLTDIQNRLEQRHYLTLKYINLLKQELEKFLN